MKKIIIKNTVMKILLAKKNIMMKIILRKKLLILRVMKKKKIQIIIKNYFIQLKKVILIFIKK